MARTKAELNRDPICGSMIQAIRLHGQDQANTLRMATNNVQLSLVLAI